MGQSSLPSIPVRTRNGGMNPGEHAARHNVKKGKLATQKCEVSSRDYCWVEAILPAYFLTYHSNRYLISECISGKIYRSKTITEQRLAKNITNEDSACTIVVCQVCKLVIILYSYKAAP
jgi:hypothetical protein